MELEDRLEDILAKAMRGQDIGRQTVAEQTSIDAQVIRSQRNGEFDPKVLRMMAPILNLKADALIAVARGSYKPQFTFPDGLKCFTTPFRDYTVNNWLIWNTESKTAVAFDTGTDASPLLDFVATEKLTLKALYLTHTHPDHLAALDKFKEMPKIRIYSPSEEGVPNTLFIEAGETHTWDGLSVQARLTNGHCPGGLTYVISGLAQPAAVVGDAVFAGSIGGVPPFAYNHALQRIQEEIMSLPNPTLLCCGHGPLTSVAQEKQSNPFL